jgi:hypothetical protein
MDIMDFDGQSDVFDQAYIRFRLTIKLMEKRLSAAMVQSFGGSLSFPEKLQMLTLYRDLDTREYIQVRSHHYCFLSL